MKSFPGNVGNVNLRGKRYKSLSCGCCDAVDLRPKYDDLLAKREIRDAFAQGIEAGTAETGTGSVHESPVGEAEAPKR